MPKDALEVRGCNMLLRQLGDQVLTYQWRGMKRNLSLLTKEIMQLRLNAEIKGVKRELKYPRRDGKAALIPTRSSRSGGAHDLEVP